jgi:thiol-disulfide isomerase/thioredoxin
MKKLFFALAIVAIACFAFTRIQKEEFSKEALAEKLADLDGNQVAFGDIIKKHKGKAVVIEVWASWCGDCVKAMPKLKDMQASNPEVDFVFISMDKTANKWKTGIENHELKGDHYWAADGMKGAFGTAINLDWIPRYILIDKKGKVVLYRAVETDFEKMNDVLKDVKS